MGQPLLFSTQDRDTMVVAPTHDSAVSPCFHGCPAFLHRLFPAWYAPSHPLDPSLCSQQQPSPWDCSTISKLQLPATYILGYVWLRQGLFPSQPWLFLLWLRQLPDVGIRLRLQSSRPLRAGAVLLTLLFLLLVPSSYRVLHGSIYSFLLVRYSRPLSAGVLKVYSWFIRGERCIPRPPTPLPSCNPKIEY